MINVTKTLDWILQLENPSDYKVALAGHGIDNADIELVKTEKEYQFTSSTPIIKGAQTHKELNFQEADNIVLTKGDRQLHIDGNHFFVRNIAYDGDNMRKIIKGTLTAFRTTSVPEVFDNKCLRMVLPINKGKINMYSFQGRHLDTTDHRGVIHIPVTISGKNYRFFIYKYGDREFIIMDSESPITLTEFRKITHCILLTYGFVKGNYFSDECYIAAYNDASMTDPLNINYHSTRSTLLTGQGVHTSNPFSVYHDVDFERDEKYFIKKEVQEKLYEGVTLFPAETFSKFAEAMYVHEKFQRAMLMFIHGHDATLEMRLPNYYVALEAIAAQIGKISEEGKKEVLNPIKNDEIAKIFISDVKTLAEKAKASSGLSNTDFDMTILEKNIFKLNAPPNADKLGKAFTLVGFDLATVPDSKKVLNDRNTYLHGGFSVHADDELSFQTALHTGLRLHFMIAALMLKYCGFSGKIINYAALWKHITKKEVNEERLIMI